MIHEAVLIVGGMGLGALVHDVTQWRKRRKQRTRKP